MDEQILILTGDNMKKEYLAHYGIEGQKYGVRRYQYKDGSLTPEGRIRYGVRSEEELRKLKEKQQKKKEKEYIKRQKAEKRVVKEAKEEKKNQESTKVDYKKMSNEELRALTDRMNLEKNYLEAQKNLAYASYTPKQKSKGKEYVTKYLNQSGDRVISAAAGITGDVFRYMAGKEVNKLFNANVVSLNNNKKKEEK